MRRRAGFALAARRAEVGREQAIKIGDVVRLFDQGGLHCGAEDILIGDAGGLNRAQCVGGLGHGDPHTSARRASMN